MEIKVTENGKEIMRMATDQFMAIAKENFGIGRSCFLTEYVDRYNALNPTMKAEIVLKGK